MGLIEKIFKKPKQTQGYNGYYKTFTAYSPVFTSRDGGLYESELVRAAIHARATHISKLAVHAEMPARPGAKAALEDAPSEFMTWGQYLYRLSTILDTQNTAFVAPIQNDAGETVGFYPLLPTQCALLDYGGQPYLQFRWPNGGVAAIERNKCGILRKFQYRDDFFGESNAALIPTMDLIDIQTQGIQEAVKSSATYRFMAKVTNFTMPEDLAKERERFTRENFSGDGGGLLLFPNTYDGIQQIKSTPFVVEAAQMEAIKSNVYTYFGVNDDVLQNKAYGDAWSAFYEGAVEPFAIQFSDVHTHMLRSDRIEGPETYLMATANRLQYMTNADKLNVSAQMADRGIMNRDEIRQIWNLPPLPNGEGKAYTIRGEYYLLGDKKEVDTKDDQQ